jgi:hypothetical protein
MFCGLRRLVFVCNFCKRQKGAPLKITFIEAIKILRADYEQVSRTTVRRLAQATKRRPVHPHIVHAIGMAAMRKPLRYVINRKKTA